MTRVAAISEIAVINPAMPRSVRELDSSTLVPFLPMSAVSEDGTASYDEWRPISEMFGGYTYFERGDVLIAKITPCFENGKAAHVTSLPAGFGFASTEFHVLRPGPHIDGEYLFHTVWNSLFRAAGKARMSGSAGQKRLPTEFLRGWRAPLPSLNEQVRVAKAIALVNSARRSFHQAAQLSREFLRSAFLEFFGDPTIGGSNWPLRALAEVAQIERGRFTPRPRNDPRFYGGSHPFLQTGDLARADGDISTWKQTLNAEGASVSREFPGGSIAVSIAANIGDTAIVNFDYFCPDSVVAIVPNPNEVRAEYLESCLTFFKPGLVLRAPMTAQRNINLAILRPLVVPVPPMKIQERFASLRIKQRVTRGRLLQQAAHSEQLGQSLHASFFCPASVEM